jgi:hypothetical protein
MKKLLPRVISILLLLVVFLAAGAVEAKAAPFTRVTVRYDRMMTGKLSSIQVILVPVTVGTEAKIKLIFGGVTIGAGQSATTAPIPAGSVAVPGLLAATGTGTSAVTVTGLTDLTVGTTYAFNLSIGGTLGSVNSYSDIVQTLTAGDVVIDQTTVTSRIIANDQITINANVPPTFTFVLSGNTDAFTTDLSSAAVAVTTGITVSVSTNAAKGWTGWVKSLNMGLNSVTTGESIGTSGVVNGAPTACGIGTDCYVLDADLTTNGAGSGTLAIDPEYLGVGTSDGGTLSSTFQPFANRTGKTVGDVITLIAKASMIATKAAGSDYTDTLTVVGAGNF